MRSIDSILRAPLRAALLLAALTSVGHAAARRESDGRARVRVLPHRPRCPSPRAWCWRWAASRRCPTAGSPSPRGAATCGSSRIPSSANGGQPHFTRFAQGLHEALGLAYRDGALYTTQRSELTRLRDTDGDGKADRYETVASWPLSGNYHEYSFGPVFSPKGEMFVTLNLAWIGYGESFVKWRGWMLKVGDDGKITPWATGFRSPSSFGFNLDGDLFYSENQGDWVGSGGISHVEKGDFMGNVKGLKWSGEPGSPVTLKVEDIPDTGEPKFEVAKKVPHLKTPAVWFPHTILGISTSAILVDSTRGTFGPFAGQLFVGDQGQSKIMRVALEKVNGVYQGAVFPFREGFMSGVFRQVWGKDGSMYVGQTSRGWGATGRALYGLQRLVWTGKVPFEPHHVSARPGRLRDLLHRAGRSRRRGESRELRGEQLHLQVPPHLRLAADQSARSCGARRRRREGWDERAASSWIRSGRATSTRSG